MIGKLTVITGLDGSGTSSIAEALCHRDPKGVLFKTPGPAFDQSRHLLDGDVRVQSPAAHYLFYLSSVVHASSQIEESLKTRNVYCVRYLIDTVVSHRVAGLNVELQYECGYYTIKKPDVTLFVTIDEGVRQDRISRRGKSDLDKVLDDPVQRARFLEEFERYSDQYHLVDNSTTEMELPVQTAISYLPWVDQK